VTSASPRRGRLGRRFAGRLWSNRGFLKLWSGQSISQLGTQVTLLALPTTAIAILGATPAQLGLMTGLGFLCYPVFGPFAGVWADRLPRRPILVVCDLVRFAALLSVPAAFVAGRLTMAQVYGVTVVTSAASTFFDVAYQAYLPTLIDRSDVMEGNSKLETSRSAAVIVGPAIAGALLQVVRAALVVLLDALSYLVSAVTLLWIRSREAPGAGPAARRSFLRELADGTRHLLGHDALWRIAICTATLNLGSGMVIALRLVFAYHDLGLSPGVVGAAFGIGSAGTLVGALSTGPLSRRWSRGAVLVLSAIGIGMGNLLVPLAEGGAAVAALLVYTFLTGMCSVMFNINQISLTQQVVPDRLLGRVAATIRTVSWGAVGLGALLAGGLGSRYGVLPALATGAAVSLAGPLWLVGMPALGPAGPRSR
jgi:MFS family permease